MRTVDCLPPLTVHPSPACCSLQSSMRIGAEAHGNTVPIRVTAQASATAEATAILGSGLCGALGSGSAAANANSAAYAG